MEQSTAYLIMFFFPLIPWLLKLTVSYKIRYKTSKLNVDRFYKKNKSSFINKFFYKNLKNRINYIIYYANFLTGCLLLFSILLAIIYLILAMLQYELSFFLVPQAAMYVTIALTVVLIIFGIFEIVDDKTKK